MPQTPNKRLVFFILQAALLSISFCQNVSQNANCTLPFQCGTLANLNYPFWGSNRPSSCGYPGFELDCNTQLDIPLLTISSVTYRVLNINFSARTLTLARQDLFNTTCPITPLSHNTTLTPNIFQFPSNPEYENVTIYYSCTSNSNSTLQLQNQFACDDLNGVTTLNLFRTGDGALSGPGVGITCNSSISVPVNQTAARVLQSSNSSINDLEDALANGFPVRWSSADANEVCESCRGSGGTCGCDGSGTVCYIENQGRLQVWGTCLLESQDKAHLSPPQPYFTSTELSQKWIASSPPSPIRRLSGYGNGGGWPPVQSPNSSPDGGWPPVQSPYSSWSPPSIDPPITPIQSPSPSVWSPPSPPSIEYPITPTQSPSPSGWSPPSPPISDTPIQSPSPSGWPRVPSPQRSDPQNANARIYDPIYPESARPNKTGQIIGEVLGTTVAVLLIIVGIFYYIRIRRSRGGHNKKSNLNVKNFLLQRGSLALKQYKYSEIKKMTKPMSEKLGQGGYGSVYKGKLPDGILVAVKVLNDTNSNGEDFINEVASISRTSHVNIVNLLGFCFEKKHRVLVYEYMPNKSLDKFIGNSNGSNILDLKILYKIAIGVAKGLEYLHTGCNTRIVHFDIKPQNILLDEEFCPKISDFGLAKLCRKKQSLLSEMGTRGTIGYIAPEVYSRNFGGVSHKSDVYSYGMMVLDMAGAKTIANQTETTQSIDNCFSDKIREQVTVETSQSTGKYFPDKIYEQVIVDVSRKLDGFITEEGEETGRKMFLVGFWCIQTNPSDRPSISKVLEMLEGSVKFIPIPPKPVLSSPNLRPVLDFSSTFSSFAET